MGAMQCSLPPDVSIGHGMKGFADDIAGEDQLGLLGNALVEGHIQKPALRPLLRVLDQGRGLPGAWGSQEERSDPLTGKNYCKGCHNQVLPMFTYLTSYLSDKCFNTDKNYKQYSEKRSRF